MGLKRNAKRGLAGLGIVAMLATSLMTGVSADTTHTNDVKVNINAPDQALSLEVSGAVDFAPITLQGTPQTYNTGFDGKFTVQDLRGTQEGYHLQVEATAFESVDHVLPTGSLTIADFTNIERVGKGTGDAPTGVLTSDTIIDDGAVTVLNAADGVGAGIFDVTFGADALGLTVDATTAKVGDYTSNLTWNLNSTPDAG